MLPITSSSLYDVFVVELWVLNFLLCPHASTFCYGSLPWSTGNHLELETQVNSSFYMPWAMALYYSSIKVIWWVNTKAEFIHSFASVLATESLPAVVLWFNFQTSTFRGTDCYIHFHHQSSNTLSTNCVNSVNPFNFEP